MAVRGGRVRGAGGSVVFDVVLPPADGTNDLGSAALRWNEVWTETLALKDAITAPGTSAGNARVYVDAADNHLKVKFGDGSVAKLVPDIPCQSVATINRAMTQVSFTDATGINAEQTYFTFSIPGNTLLANGYVRLTIFGTYLNNSGAGRTLTLAVKLGATTLISDVTLSIVNNAGARAWRMEILLGNQNATNAQNATIVWSMSAPDAMTGTGDFAANDTLSVTATGTAAIDTTQAAVLAVTMLSSAATATQNLSKEVAILECSPSA